MKKAIIFHISDFGGHSKAAANIKEALQYRDPHIDVLNLNGFGYFFPHLERFVDFMYTTTIKHVPYLWRSIYDRKKIIKGLTPCQKFISRKTFKDLAALVGDYKPDCYVATQAFPCCYIADFKKAFGVTTPLVAVVTDYHPHRFWIHNEVDKYVVACPEAKETLVREGVGPKKVKVSGIPISVDFLTSFPKATVAQDFGFIPDLPSVLIMGGGLGWGPLKKLAQELDELDDEFQIIVVTGRNQRLYQWFIKNRRYFRRPLFCFGYVDFVHKLMDYVDIIITKAGGITVSEALAKGLALIVTQPIPGQEERNVDYLLSKNAIVQADSPQHIGGWVKELLENKDEMYALREEAKGVSLIDSSLRIADLILSEIG